MNLIDTQKQLLNDIIKNSKIPEDVMYAEEKLKELTGLPSSIITPRYASYGHPPDVDSHNLISREMYMDMVTISIGTDQIAKEITEAYNYNAADIQAMTNHLRKISSVITDLSLISEENEYNTIYFKDTFVNKDYVDDMGGLGSDVLTSEGVAVLHINSLAEFPSTVINIAGNGDVGNHHVVKENTDAKAKNKFAFLSESLPNNDKNAITDGEINTWFEYQAINIGDKKYYDTGWAKDSERLRLKVTLQLDEVQTINWLSLTPYYPDKSRRRMKVHSVKLSENGIDYSPIGNELVINENINITPQTYRIDTKSASSFKSKGVGVWNFPATKCKYIELVLDQDEAYTEKIGHTVYKKTTNDSEEEIPEDKVPEGIAKGMYGKTEITDGVSITKELVVFDGERKCIGIRDIAVYGYYFDIQSHLLTKRFTSTKPIEAISLFANEVIPEEFLTNLTKHNNWIRYYISIDDINWYQISPMHHRPYNTESFPPKMVTFKAIDKENTLNVLNIPSDKDVYSVRLKIVFSRPNDNSSIMMTPVLQDYALRCTLKE